ncbi:serine protease [Streptococcus suis]|uniref:serine protease n=1 Tax=Streptococcus suis TaxID=1307 RepID=UPI000C19BC0B|nr:serine protease [Streptococcus suis]
MERKFEKLSLSEAGIIAFMTLILLISLGASWYNDSQTVAETSKTNQELVKEDPNYKAAENAVIELERNKTKEKLELAQAAIDAVNNPTLKARLQASLDKVRLDIAKLADAQTNANKEASTSTSSSSVVASSTTETSTRTYQESVSSNYISPVQNSNAVSTPVSEVSSVPSAPVEQPVTTTPEPSVSTSPEVTEPPVVETPVTEPPVSTETSPESSATSETPATSSTDNP